MGRNDWAVIHYTLPREPSRARVSLWRKLKKTGAVSLQQSTWILPYSDRHLARLHELKTEIFKNGGEAVVMTSSVDDDGKKLILSRFNEARDEEYTELQEQCEDFLKEIDKETVKENFSFAEVEENEAELSKLQEWFAKIGARDFFGASLAQKSQQMLSGCEAALEAFCSRVYELLDKKGEE